MDLIFYCPSLDKLFHLFHRAIGENAQLLKRSLDSALSFPKSWFVFWNTPLWASIFFFYFMVILRHLAGL